ncbi:MAG TPA: hypothetical protein VK968_11305 [Roseimicrobium sp.]|nr:hypothetical protein [Roseimicrobium sp.]
MFEPASVAVRGPHRVSVQTSVLMTAMEMFILLFYLCLVYKQAALGVVAMVAIGGIGLLFPFRATYIFTVLGLFSIFYVADATVTAFLVDRSQGIYRTAQFFIIVFAGAGVTNYFLVAPEERKRTLLFRFTVITAVVFGTMILYHLSIGRIMTWKYLYDTKTTISIVVILLFIYESELKRRIGGGGWFTLLGFISVLVLMSGERKAYLLLAILFFLSRTSIPIKALAVLVAGGMIGLYAVTAEEGNIVARQLTSIFTPTERMYYSQFFMIDNLGDYSDLVREFVNGIAWEQFLANPFLGLGANGYQVHVMEMFGLVGRNSGLTMNVHGEINRIPTEGGLLGIFIAVVLLVLAGFGLFRLVTRGMRSGLDTGARTMIYAFCFLLSYTMFEALDTLMLVLIILFGFELARMLHVSRPSGLRQRGAPLPN